MTTRTKGLSPVGDSPFPATFSDCDQRISSSHPDGASPCVRCHVKKPRFHPPALTCLRAHSALTCRPRAHHSYRSEEHTSELQSLMRISYAVFCLKKKKQTIQTYHQLEYVKQV